MTRQILPSEDVKNDKKESEQDFFRFHLPHSHLLPVFGSDWFALKAEAFAQFFGTPVFLIAQTVVVAIWILTNALGFFTFWHRHARPTGIRLMPLLMHSTARTSTALVRKDRNWPNTRQLCW